MVESPLQFLPLRERHIVVGVSSSIAAYKACELVRQLLKRGAETRVVMTRNATELVGPKTFEALSGYPVGVDTFDTNRWQDDHIGLADWADCFVVAPATANVIGKLAAGLADDLLTTASLAMTCPRAIAPAMNERMYLNPQVQENLRHLSQRGWTIIEPGAGLLACGSSGPGRLAEPEDIADIVQALAFDQRDFSGARIIVTAGPTYEALDPVRFIGNRSSGKMGYALARAARDRGALVTLISGPVALTPPAGARFIAAGTAREMLAASLKEANEADAFIACAAVGDFRAAYPSDTKLKREQGELAIVVQPNPDIVAQVARAFPELVKVGFAAESDDLLANAQAKLASKQLDLIVANDISASDSGFEVDTNRALLIVPGHEPTETELLPKEALAHLVLDRVVELLVRKGRIKRWALTSGEAETNSGQTESEG